MLYSVQKNGDHTMADKNLHDIKIDDLESSKKTPLKNLLTLLALLFIILVISVVITKLILNTDSDTDANENNISTTEIDTNGSENSALATTGAALAGATGAAIATTQNAAATAGNTIKNSASNIKDSASNAANSVKETTKDLASATTLKERNITGSKTKVTLRDHRPLSSVKELVEPKSTAKKDTSSSSSKKSRAKKDTASSSSKKSRASSKKSTYVKRATSTHNVKVDRVIAKKTTSTKKSTSTKSRSTKSVVGYTLTPGYYIKIGTFKDSSSAVQQIKKTGLNYKLIKVKDDKTLTRVFIGTFKSKANAQSNLNKAKKISKGAYIIKK
jgi:cell division protein FtsN